MKEDLEEKGILPKYIIQKSNGDPVSPNAEYFVLRLDNNGSDPDHIWACRRAIVLYAYELYMQDRLPALFEDIMNRWGWETIARQIMQEVRYDNDIEYDEERILEFLPRVIDGVKKFFSVNRFQMTDETFKKLACPGKDEISDWWLKHPGYDELNKALNDYFD